MTTVLSEESHLSLEDEPASQGFYYGWVMLPVSMAALIATAPGQTFGVSIFNDPMRRSLGLSHGEIASAYMLGTLLAAAPISYIGTLTDRFGLRRMMTISVVLFGLACVVTSQVSGWFSLFLAFWMLRLLGPGVLSFASGNTLAYWFRERLGTVEGVRHLGMAASMAVIPALNLWLVECLGWRGAYAALGIAVWALMLPIILLFFRNRPEDIGQTMDGMRPLNRRFGAASTTSESLEDNDRHRVKWGFHDFTLRESLRTKSFWIVTAGTSVFGLIHTAVFFCIVPILSERGLSGADATRMLTVFALSLATMQVVGGTFADRFPAHRLLPLALAGLAGGIYLLLHATSPIRADLSGAALGLSQGLFFGTSNPLWARYFGLAHLGNIRGTLVTLNVASSSLGPLIFGVARDSLGNYDLALSMAAFVPLPLILLSFAATPPARNAAA